MQVHLVNKLYMFIGDVVKKKVVNDLLGLPKADMVKGMQYSQEDSLPESKSSQRYLPSPKRRKDHRMYYLVILCTTSG